MPEPGSTLHRTLGQAELAQAWLRRLRPALDGDAHDALVVIEGPPAQLGARFPLDRAAARIELGRGAEAPRAPADPIALASEFVSSPHAALEAEPDGWWLRDLGSSNHTYVGTVRIERQRLVYGDEIRAGDVVLLFTPAQVESLPGHVLDQASGLLAPRVFVAEAGRLAGAVAPDGGQRWLLLCRVHGLRQALVGAEETARSTIARIGQALLAVFADGGVLGRLELDLFGACWHEAADAARARAERARARLAALAAAAALDGVSCTLGAAAEGCPLPRELAAGLAALDEAGAEQQGVLDLEPAAERRLLAGDGLLAALDARPDLTLVLIGLEEEDSLRHQLGHAGLAAQRFRVGRLARRLAAELGAGVAGVLDERAFVLGLDAVDPDAVTERGRALLAARPPPAGLEIELAVATLAPRERARGRTLRRQILAAVEGAPTRAGGDERLVVEHMPTPIAAPYSLAWVVASATARAKTVLDAAEVSARFVALVALAAAARFAGEEARSLLRAALAQRAGRPLPFGDWIALLRSAATLLDPRASPIAARVARALAAGKRGVLLAQLLERRLLPARNSFVHGTLAPREESAAAHASELVAELNEVLRCLRPLEELSLVAVLESSLRRGGGARATVRALSGPRENFEVWQIDVRASESLYQGSVYLATPDYRGLLELQPLVRLALCTRCDREEVFVADALPRWGRALELRAVSTAHQLRIELGEEDAPEWLATLLPR